jgi:hypothetical protein
MLIMIPIFYISGLAIPMLPTFFPPCALARSSHFRHIPQDVTGSGSTVTVGWNMRAYLVNGATPTTCGVTSSTFSATKSTFSLLGKTLAFTVSASTAACGCNVALYLVSMPALTSTGAINPADNQDAYCDANPQGSSGYCPEL